jgi:DNA-binding IclR family transcriptional regulator
MGAVRKFVVKSGEPLNAAEIAKKYSISRPEYHQILNDFIEMPGLTLTAPQASRLFGLPLDQARSLLDGLVDEGILERRGQAYRQSPPPAG